MPLDVARIHRQLAAGNINEAARLAQAALTSHPDNPHAWHAAGTVYFHAQHLADAIRCAEKAVSLAPREPIWLLQCGRYLFADGRRQEALQVANRVAGLSLSRADLNDALGTLLTYLGHPDRALGFHARAVESSPDDSALLYNLATAQRMTGDLAGARRSLERAIELQPRDVQAFYLLADLNTQTADANHVEAMTRLLRAGGLSASDEIMLCFALAKELEDMGEYRVSFEYLQRGCELQRQRIIYKAHDDLAGIDRLLQVFSAADASRAAAVGSNGFDTQECIFIFGLPRTGTTLVENILASHSNIVAGGELDAFPREVLKAVRCLPQTAGGSRDLFDRMLEVDPVGLGRAYMAAARPDVASGRRFTDKLPTNYLYAGLIHRALPRAPMIAVLRDPMDSCYAMYKTLFVDAYPFSYTLSELGPYYAAWHKLMTHWKSVLGDSLLIVQYEDLVANQEAVTRRMLAHCGLEWEEGCIDVHRRGQMPVSTASATQVRRAIYQSSVGKWRHYESELASLRDFFREHEPKAGWGL